MNAISITYTDQQLRILTEEYIAMQRSEFSFKSVCSYILYRAMEELQTTVYTRAINWIRKTAKESALFWRRLLVKVELNRTKRYS